MKQSHFFHCECSKRLCRVTCKLIEHIFRNGYHCPKTFNPADFLIGVLSKSEPEKKPDSVAHRLCDAFEASYENQPTFDLNEFIMEEDKLHEIQKPHWIFTIMWLIYRNLLIVVRDPTVQKLRIVQKIVNMIKYHCDLQCATKKTCIF